MMLRTDELKDRFMFGSPAPGDLQGGKLDPETEPAGLLRNPLGDDLARAAGDERVAEFRAALGPLGPVSARFNPEARPHWLAQIWDAIVEFFLAFVDPETATFNRPERIRAKATEIWRALTPEQRRALADLFGTRDFARDREFYAAQLASAVRSRPAYTDGEEGAQEDAVNLLQGLRAAARRYPPPPRAEERSAPWAVGRHAVDMSRGDFMVDPRSALFCSARHGETLSGIARERNIPLDALVAANPQITNTWHIETGQIIALPEPVGPEAREAVERRALDRFAVSRANLHIVQRGDTLAAVAGAHGTTPEALIALNPQVSSTGRIYPEDVLRLRTPPSFAGDPSALPG